MGVSTWNWSWMEALWCTSRPLFSEAHRVVPGTAVSESTSSTRDNLYYTRAVGESAGKEEGENDSKGGEGEGEGENDGEGEGEGKGMGEGEGCTIQQTLLEPTAGESRIVQMALLEVHPREVELVEIQIREVAPIESRGALPVTRPIQDHQELVPRILCGIP